MSLLIPFLGPIRGEFPISPFWGHPGCEVAQVEAASASAAFAEVASLRSELNSVEPALAFRRPKKIKKNNK